MIGNLEFYDDVEAVERFINVPKGALKNIPIYARVPAVDAILKVKKMESESLFRPGLYYIVLADLRGNTAFNAKYGNSSADTRVQWFQTSAVQALGEINPSNYATYIKAIGDAALLIFASFEDVAKWSAKFTSNLNSMSEEYTDLVDPDEDDFEQRLEDFQLRARRLVHLGEVKFDDSSDPMCLAVSQTFKIEKAFETDDLGCTEAVLTAVRPLLPDIGIVEMANKPIRLPGDTPRFPNLLSGA